MAKSKSILILSIFLLTFQSSSNAQIKTAEVKVRYPYGYNVFTICVSNCETAFNDNKDYFWYTEFSKIKSTKGGAGGSLLHGNSKSFDNRGNLRQDKNYYLGLLEGSEKNWDSLGNIISQKKYIKGDITYWKVHGDNGYWVEHIGPSNNEGWVTKTYNKNDTLVMYQVQLPDLKIHTKAYYENPGKTLKEEYTSKDMRGEYLVGKYTTFYETGNIHTDGQFYEGDFPNLKVGVWNWYKPDGTLEITEQYKDGVELWGNGKIKVSGNYILDTDKTWKKNGEWRWYSIDGDLQSRKKYVWGVEAYD